MSGNARRRREEDKGGRANGTTSPKSKRRKDVKEAEKIKKTNSFFWALSEQSGELVTR